MPGTPHEVILLAIREKPELFAEIVRRVRGTEIPGPIEAIDSNVRFAVSLETRPDLVLRTPDAASKWTIVELQNRQDERKCRSWPLAASVLLQREGMGDVVVITASRSVAAWAKRAAHHRGLQGTSLGLTPVVLLLSDNHASTLLDPVRPELALFAVWACCRGNGPSARRVATRALKLTAKLPAPLRDAQRHAIFAMLSEKLLTEMAMDISKIPETKASRALWRVLEKRGQEREVQGEARGLLALLAARGLSPTKEERASIAALADLTALDRCIQTAATATSVAEVLASAGVSRRRVARSGTPKPRTSKPKSRRGNGRVNGRSAH